MNVTCLNQVWVSDITYVRTVSGFCYLALITDMYSRRIMDYDMSDSLELADCLRALKKALRHVRQANGIVYHSDRDFQYCSNHYVDELKKHGRQISMTEDNHCYKNTIAERVNGILKDEFHLDQWFYSTNRACEAAKNPMDIYNSKRLHLSLGYKTPILLPILQGKNDKINISSKHKCLFLFKRKLLYTNQAWVQVDIIYHKTYIWYI